MTTNENYPNMTAKEIDQSTYIKQLKITINRIRTERDKYRKALQDIKKLVEKDYCSEYETCKECYNESTCKNNCINKEILQKCEVVND